MKRLALCLILGMICMVMVSFAGAQERAGKARPSSKGLPPEVCKAIEQYVAKIDSARAVKDMAARTRKYGEAALELAAVLNPRSDKDALLTLAADYVTYTERVVAGDAKDANLDELLEKRLNTRTKLLEMCSSYTTTR